MTKKYIVKWYDWNAGHYNEKECESQQLNFSNDFHQYYCPICKVYQIFKRNKKNKYKCMNCENYTLSILKH